MSPVTNENSIDRKPLEIRGHHLKRLKMLFNFYSSFRSIEDAVGATASCAKIAAENSKNPGYKEDLSGATEDEQLRYWESYRTLLTSFLVLPDNHTVRIIQDKRDDFCRLCVAGKHCLENGPWGMSTDRYVVWSRMGTNYANRLSSDGEIEMSLGGLKEALSR